MARWIIGVDKARSTLASGPSPIIGRRMAPNPSCETFNPLGPWIATTDEVKTPQALSLWLSVNGEERQNASTADLIFDIPQLIETLSAGITLYPGDVIATGTPVGVGIGFKPPKYLQAGDVVRVEIDGIGSLENPVR